MTMMSNLTPTILTGLSMLSSMVKRIKMKLPGNDPKNWGGTMIRNMLVESQLDIPDGMLDMTDDELDECCNGCGAEGSFITQYIPEDVDGVNITSCCNIHDYLFYIGGDFEDYLYANRKFIGDLLKTTDIYANTNGLTADEIHELHNKVLVYFHFVDKYSYSYFINTKGIRRSTTEVIDILNAYSELSKPISTD